MIIKATQGSFKFFTPPKICEKCKSTRFEKLDWIDGQKVYYCKGCGMVYDPIEYSLDEALHSKEFGEYLAGNVNIGVMSGILGIDLRARYRTVINGRWLTDDDQLESAHYVVPTMIDYAENVDSISQEIGAATMQDPKTVAYALHSVIEGIGNAPQHKATKPLSEREQKRRKRLKRPVAPNYYRDNSTGNSYVTEKVLRGKSR